MSDEAVAIELTVNGTRIQAQAEPRMLLADFIRHRLHLTGTHVGCAHGACGACTVLVNGQPARSCLMFAVQAQGAEVMTVEALENTQNKVRFILKKHIELQKSWLLVIYSLKLKRLQEPVIQ